VVLSDVNLEEGVIIELLNAKASPIPAFDDNLHFICTFGVYNGKTFRVYNEDEGNLRDLIRQGILKVIIRK
jgi:hypothetical protein